MELYTKELKDESPVKTVQQIKALLGRVDIETEEAWFDSKVPYCHAVRVTVKGTTFGTNGKGLTRDLALASGYGELMERLQLGYIGSRSVQKDGHFSVNDGHCVELSVNQLLEQNPGWYAGYSRQLQELTGTVLTPEQLLSQFADKQGMLTATPYLNISTGEKVYFPSDLRKAVYSTNGCAAGNTPEEAIVQAISEIVERNHHMKVVSEDITLPDIPDSFLKRYSRAYDIITYLRGCGFRVFVKDASLGTKFPVVCVCYIQESTGKYHTHFGASPIFEIALERALSETFQGRTLDHFAQFENFFFSKDDKYNITSITSELNQGTWERTANFFAGEPKYAFNENAGFTGSSNKAILNECVAWFREMGCDLLVRDSSCLGFPTYQVIVPGYSESFVYRMNRKLDDSRYAAFAVKTLRNPAAASIEDMIGLTLHLNQLSQIAKNIPSIHGFLACAKLSAEMDRGEESRLMAASLAYVWYTLNRSKDVLGCIGGMFPQKDPADEEYLICLKRYLTLKSQGYPQAKIKTLLELFHQPETVARLYTCLENRENPFAPFVLRCDMRCSKECMLYGSCRQKRANELTQLIVEKTKAMDPDASAQAILALLQ